MPSGNQIPLTVQLADLSTRVIQYAGDQYGRRAMAIQEMLRKMQNGFAKAGSPAAYAPTSEGLA